MSMDSSISMLNASNSMMSGLMQTLMKGMQQSTELATDIVAVNLENSIAGEKVELAQQIIDVYA